jgi:hypothetical protein
MGGMKANGAKKWLVFVMAGFLLSAVCGTLVMFGFILSWTGPFHSWPVFLKFALHPTTLLFFVGIWLIYRGVSMRDTTRK